MRERETLDAVGACRFETERKWALFEDAYFWSKETHRPCSPIVSSSFPRSLWPSRSTKSVRTWRSHRQDPGGHSQSVSHVLSATWALFRRRIFWSRETAGPSTSLWSSAHSCVVYGRVGRRSRLGHGALTARTRVRNQATKVPAQEDFAKTAAFLLLPLWLFCAPASCAHTDPLFMKFCQGISEKRRRKRANPACTHASPVKAHVTAGGRRRDTFRRSCGPHEAARHRRRSQRGIILCEQRSASHKQFWRALARAERVNERTSRRQQPNTRAIFVVLLFSL